LTTLGRKKFLKGSKERITLNLSTAALEVKRQWNNSLQNSVASNSIFQEALVCLHPRNGDSRTNSMTLAEPTTNSFPNQTFLGKLKRSMLC
jgi:hypothetical protein